LAVLHIFDFTELVSDDDLLYEIASGSKHSWLSDFMFVLLSPLARHSDSGDATDVALFVIVMLHPSWLSRITIEWVDDGW